MADAVNLKVAVRVRPFLPREKERGAVNIVEMRGPTTILHTPAELLKKKEQLGQKEAVREFTFDYSYDSFDPASPSFDSQDRVFQDLGMMVLNNAWEGYNSTIFAYGQTGSGKSYTMIGDIRAPEQRGLTPRVLYEMFARIDRDKRDDVRFEVKASFMEIYHEAVRDLLLTKQQAAQISRAGLRVREDPKTGPFVEGLTEVPVKSYDDVQRLVDIGTRHRVTASTQMNDVSSRSHALLTINFMQTIIQKEQCKATDRASKVHLVDLAGCERAKATGASGDQLKESCFINKSLHTLGLVISGLAELGSGKKQNVFLPYRDSVLTYLLKESLGGNSKTAMVAAISPADYNFEETLSTLRFADRAKQIKNQAKVNEDPNLRVIRELKAEMNKLKQEHAEEILRLIREKDAALALLRKHETGELDQEMENLKQEALKQRDAFTSIQSEFKRMEAELNSVKEEKERVEQEAAQYRTLVEQQRQRASSVSEGCATVASPGTPAVQVGAGGFGLPLASPALDDLSVVGVDGAAAPAAASYAQPGAMQPVHGSFSRLGCVSCRVPPAVPEEDSSISVLNTTGASEPPAAPPSEEEDELPPLPPDAEEPGGPEQAADVGDGWVQCTIDDRQAVEAGTALRPCTAGDSALAIAVNVACVGGTGRAAAQLSTPGAGVQVRVAANSVRDLRSPSPARPLGAVNDAQFDSIERSLYAALEELDSRPAGVVTPGGAAGTTSGSSVPAQMEAEAQRRSLAQKRRRERQREMIVEQLARLQELRKRQKAQEQALEVLRRNHVEGMRHQQEQLERQRALLNAIRDEMGSADSQPAAEATLAAAVSVSLRESPADGARRSPRPTAGRTPTGPADAASSSDANVASRLSASLEQMYSKADRLSELLSMYDSLAGKATSVHIRSMEREEIGSIMRFFSILHPRLCALIQSGAVKESPLLERACALREYLNDVITRYQRLSIRCEALAFSPSCSPLRPRV